MKLTNTYNQYLHPDLIEDRRQKSAIYNEKNKEKARVKRHLIALRKKYTNDLVDSFIDMHGEAEAIIEIPKYIKSLGKPNIYVN
jgi:hypothetical protein